MNEVAFDRMITGEYERYKIIEKEYKRYKPVASERKVYNTYKSVSVKKGAYKTLLQWEEQVKSDYSVYSHEWLKETIKVAEYRGRVNKTNLQKMRLTYGFAASALLLTAFVLTVLFNALTLICVPFAMVFVVISYFYISSAFGVLDRVLFYQEFVRVLKGMTG